MELDTLSHSSDEVDEFSFSEHGISCPNDFVFTEDVQPDSVEAKEIYLLLPKNVPIPRASRVQWLLSNLNKVVTVANPKSWETSSNIEVISVIPREQNLNIKCNRFLVTYRTELKFIAHAYRFVYCIDMSPSLARVDLDAGIFLFDQLINIFKTSVESLAQQFVIPGCPTVFQPDLYLTVMANTPFFVTPAQQVILEGVRVTSENVGDVAKCVEYNLSKLEGRISEACMDAWDKIDQQMVSQELRGNFDMLHIGKLPKLPMVTADANFVNMLRYSMLAISLLPEITLSHILVITDGVVAMPDSNVMETLLHQFHYDATVVSFLRVGSSFHPAAPAGMVPYTDLLIFFANSTLGTYIESFPKVESDPSYPTMNFYQNLFLLWSFTSKDQIKDFLPKPCDITNGWTSTSDTFNNHGLPTVLCKKQTEDTTGASVTLLLTRRIREGFAVDNVFYMNGKLEIKLIHQWKSSTYIHYKIISLWPPQKNLTHFEIYVHAPYEFLHDMTCGMKKEIKSVFRRPIIQRFWSRLTQITSADLNLAVQLSNFPYTKDWYTLPESVKSGIPVFSSNNPTTPDAKLSLTPRDLSCLKFVNIWQDISQMETSQWRKWFHTHKISLVLTHDTPLSTNLHWSGCSSQRYQVVQCREAVTALYGMLSEWSTFMLIDNHTYLRLVYRDQENVPFGFCIIRVSSKFPSAVLNIGFSTYTPGQIRLQICEELKNELKSLSYIPKAKGSPCCILLTKPLEKILIRYEKVPGSYTTVVLPDGTQPLENLNSFPPSTAGGSLFTTLSRYLFHKRWIWRASYPGNPRLSDISTSRILHTLIRMRLKEGFHFAYSSSGIITMVLEVLLEPNATCVVQYVVFPAHFNWVDDYDSCSEDENQPMSTDVELQLVTEVWIEPQCGKVVPSNSRIGYINGKNFHEIADEIYKIDYSCINVLLTMEHTSLMCQHKAVHNISSVTDFTYHRSYRRSMSQRSSKVPIPESYSPEPVPDFGSLWHPIISPHIEHIPFNFDPIEILHLCQQTELLYSMLIEDRSNNLTANRKVDNANKLLLGNIFEHFSLLHDRDLELTKEDCDKFTKEILLRHKNRSNHNCPVSKACLEYCNFNWKCYVKGVSVTHVILTFIPASIDDVKALTGICPNSVIQEVEEMEERSSSRASNISDVPINTPNSLCLPIYVYDCPLQLLINSYVEGENVKRPNDFYEDHRFTTTDLEEELVRIKDSSSKSSENSDPRDSKHLQLHCKALSFTHSKCFTLSLFLALHMGIPISNSDVENAMDMCEEEIIEIDITQFIKNVCNHVKQNKSDVLLVQSLREANPCRDLSNFHMLIKKKFLSILQTSFHRVPSNREYYYYKQLSIKPEEPLNDSDDEVSICASDIEFTPRRKKSFTSEDPQLLLNGEDVGMTEIAKMSDVSPLFLHLICTVKYNAGGNTNTSLKVLPTCLGELIQNLESNVGSLNKLNLHITLDILCLTLPANVQNILTEYSELELRTTSICSDGFKRSTSSVSEISVNSDYQIQTKHLTDSQRSSVDRLCEDIKWLLEDEICTTMLDAETVTVDTLNYVMQHVKDSHKIKTSCKLDNIVLNFVYSNDNSHVKFLEEFSKLPLPLGYKLCQVEQYYFITKDHYVRDSDMYSKQFDFNHTDANEALYELEEQFKNVSDKAGSYKEDTVSQQSDISSSSLSNTEAGYDEDVSDDDEDWRWIANLNNKRPLLPNFWLILEVKEDLVQSYFHCRFLEIPTSYVEEYRMVEAGVRDSIADLCKRVNQLLLLQTLYETKTCDSLLEPDDNKHNDATIYRGKFRSHDLDTSDDSDMNLHSMSQASLHFKHGFFSCPLVWEKVFILHPRLKTGTGGKARGISALRNILDKLSVSNRSNMFVHKDREDNVFYLRLQESSTLFTSRSSIKPMDNDGTTFSRSPSIASLPIGHNTIQNLAISEHSIPSISSSDLRPRVRSFGERESRSFDSKEKSNEDIVVLKVHGIAQAGTELQYDLVQVLQKKLDDAVLESLSVMLARNAMCPLTPEDVRFIQKVQSQPDHSIKLSIHKTILEWQKSSEFIVYLRQNLLQFLNIPKYTDSRPEHHFKDFQGGDQNILSSDNIFIYNQSQTPASGSRGIACIVLALILDTDPVPSFNIEDQFENIFINKNYSGYVSSNIIEGEICPKTYLEFRLWKQGRINLDNLTKYLKLTVCQATWDIMTEHYLLKKPLCIKEYRDNIQITKKKVDINSFEIDLGKEVKFNYEFDVGFAKRIRPKVTRLLPKKIDAHSFPNKRPNKRIVNQNNLKASRFITYDVERKASKESNDNGVLSTIYSKILPSWLEHGHSINTPSVKKNEIKLDSRHLPAIIVNELLLISGDSPKAFRAVANDCLIGSGDWIYVPFDSSNLIQKCIIVSRGFQQSTEDSDMQDGLNPQSLKHSQKFVPTVWKNCVIPRRKIFWISVDNESIIIYTYNWTKDNIDKLVENCEYLTKWLSVRSCYLNSVTSQKLGLFHNQPLTRKCFMLSRNSYYYLIGNLDAMFRFPGDIGKRNHQPAFNLPAVLEAFRDSFYNTKYTCSDVVAIFAIEMKEMKSLEKKNREEMKKLHSMYQSRTGTTSVTQLNLLMQNSRILHYVHTPLLFLPRWRLKSASTRDHSLYPSQAIQLADKFTEKDKEDWHTKLCCAFFMDYRNYLHTLGFTPLEIENSQSSVGVFKDKSSHNSVFYIQRTILGGILIFTASFEEPFFVLRLHAIECNRLQNITSRASVNGFTVSFLDECDKVKILMHLHSFTYDYHLVCIYKYISGNCGKLTEKYNIHNFLDDFLKYYNKAPNFARNLVHTDTLTIDGLITEGKQLYEYLRLNVHQYGFKILEMDEGCSEYILVQGTTAKHISYKDSQDRKHTDDFDMTLVVYNLCTPFKPTDNILHLKYYLILTSKRDDYPMFENEQKLGKFRTVSSTCALDSDSKSNTSKLESSSEGTDIEKSKDTIEEGSLSRSVDDKPLNKLLTKVRIRQESVNYLGYYSTHEQTMQQLILDKAASTVNDIKDMVYRGMEHCRTNLLWNRLISPQEANPLTFEEFIELKRLAKLKSLFDLHPNLRPLLNQTLSWYQGLAKLLLIKYVDQHRVFSSADGNRFYYAILHPRYYGAFMMLSLDLHTLRGDLHAVYREPHKQEDADPLSLGYEKSLRDGFVNSICFFVWSAMI